MGIFSSNSKEIKVGTDVKSNQNSYECLRIWMNQDRPMVFAQRIKSTEDPRVWGLVLADAAALVSTHNNDGSVKSRKEALEKIQSMFNTEIDRWIKQM